MGLRNSGKTAKNNLMARPNPNSPKVPWNNFDPCPCNSGEIFGKCCAQSNKLPLIKLASLSPQGQETNHSHQKCYLNFTKNCCSKISGEHYISKSVLKLFNEMNVSGMPWQAPGVKEQYHQNNLTSKILCERHNNALSPLDAAAGHFFRELFEARHHVTKRSLSNRSKDFLVCGDAIELWSLKTLLGFLHAKIARTSGKVMVGKFHLDEQTINEVLFGPGFAQPLGLYIEIQEGDLVERELGFTPLHVSGTQDLSGLVVKACGLSFTFIYERYRLNTEYFQTQLPYYRPGILDLNGKKRSSRIFITWKSQTNKGRRVAIDIREIL